MIENYVIDLLTTDGLGIKADCVLLRDAQRGSGASGGDDDADRDVGQCLCPIRWPAAQRTTDRVFFWNVLYVRSFKWSTTSTTATSLDWRPALH